MHHEMVSVKGPWPSETALGPSNPNHNARHNAASSRSLPSLEDRALHCQNTTLNSFCIYKTVCSWGSQPATWGWAKPVRYRSCISTSEISRIKSSDSKTPPSFMVVFLKAAKSELFLQQTQPSEHLLVWQVGHQFTEVLPPLFYSYLGQDHFRCIYFFVKCLGRMRETSQLLMCKARRTRLPDAGSSPTKQLLPLLHK